MGGEPTGFDDPDCMGYIEEIEGRVRKLEAALRECNEVATVVGNDERHTAQERTGARMVGASIRAILRTVNL